MKMTKTNSKYVCEVCEEELGHIEGDAKSLYTYRCTYHKVYLCGTDARTFHIKGKCKLIRLD